MPRYRKDIFNQKNVSQVKGGVGIQFGMVFKLFAKAAWAPGLDDNRAWQVSWSGDALPIDNGSAPEIRFIDPLLRRRLGRLSRMALSVAHQAAAGQDSTNAVFASRHGELSRTVGILHALAADEVPSPAAFSLSVHNSAAGIFSIARADRSQSTALAAGEETLLWAMQDAAARLAAEPDSPILLVYADEPLPGEYQAYSSRSDPAHAVALLLGPGDDLHLEWSENDGTAPCNEPLSLAILAHLMGHRDRITWHGERLSVHGYIHA